MILARPPRSRALAPFVEAVWVHRASLSHRHERVVPTGRMQLLVNLQEDVLRDYALDGHPASRVRGVALQGARTGPMIIDTLDQRAVCGVSFAPGGAWPFSRLPGSEIGGRLVDLADLWGRDGEVLRERLLEAGDPEAQLDVLEAALLERRPHALPRDRAMEAACSLLAGGSSVHDVRARLGLSPRRLIDRFRARTGLTPKLFARIARFQHALRDVESVGAGSVLAAKHGFSDQAHLIREWRTFSGTTPRGYQARSAEDRNHSPLESRQFSSIARSDPTAECAP